MVDKKITELDAIAAVVGADLLAVVDDPAGTAKTTKGTITQLAAFLDGLSETLTNKTINTASNTLTVVEADISDLQAYILDVSGSPLSELSDVTITGIAGNEILKWNGSAWINNTLAEAGISATGHSHTESDISDLQSYLLINPALGTPTSGTLTNCTGLPITGITSSTSAQLRTLLSDETGTGSAVFATSPTLVTPVLGTPASGALTNCTAVPAAQLSGIVPDANMPNLTGDVTTIEGAVATTIAAKAVDVAMLADGTDGELITWDASGVAATVAVGTSTHVLTSNGVGTAPTFQAAAGGGSGLIFAKIVKAADETVNNSDVMQDDDELLFTPTINKVYGFTLRLFVDSPAARDLKVAFTLPTGATGEFNPALIWRSDAQILTKDILTPVTVPTGSSATSYIIPITGRIIMSSTAGDANFQWAQANASAEDSKVLKGSFLVLWEEGTS